jgi:hypothetical protein
VKNALGSQSYHYRRGEELGGESWAADRFRTSPLCKMEPTGSGEVKK